MFRVHAIILVVLGFSLFNVPAVSVAASYQLLDLGTLGNVPSGSVAVNINNRGEVIGNSNYEVGNFYRHAFLYDSRGMRDLGAFGCPESIVTAINDSSQIVGNASGGYGSCAFLYQNGTMTDISSNSPYPSFMPYAINSNGQIVGLAFENGCQAICYSAGTWKDLGNLGSSVSYATDINNSGQIVGTSKNNLLKNRAFIYSGSTMSDLGTLGGAESWAEAINNSGQIVGFASTSQVYHAFLYSDGKMTDIDKLNSSYSEARGINNKGQVVGVYSGSDGQNHGFLYQNGVMTDFKSLIDPSVRWRSMDGISINDLGWIVGAGYNAQNQQHAFLMIPVPEPSTIALLLTACIGGLLWWRRR
jgi:probable HAF family extracellular repeat protein